MGWWTLIQPALRQTFSTLDFVEYWIFVLSDWVFEEVGRYTNNPPPTAQLSKQPHQPQRHLTTTMGGTDRAGELLPILIMQETISLISDTTGGKAKPLKAPKKEKKEIDEDDKAFQEKQKAGESRSMYSMGSRPRMECWRLRWSSCQSQQGDGREGQGQRSHERRIPGHQEVWQEVIGALGPITCACTQTR